MSWLLPPLYTSSFCFVEVHASWFTTAFSHTLNGASKFSTYSHKSDPLLMSWCPCCNRHRRWTLSLDEQLSRVVDHTSYENIFSFVQRCSMQGRRRLADLCRHSLAVEGIQKPLANSERLRSLYKPTYLWSFMAHVFKSCTANSVCNHACFEHLAANHLSFLRCLSIAKAVTWLESSRNLEREVSCYLGPINYSTGPRDERMGFA